MKISIVIPCLNEGAYIQATLEHTLSLKGNFEIIAVDGGSIDNTREVIRDHGMVKLICSAKGRSVQMNHGAKIATGDTLLFLHADTFLPEDTYESVTKAFKNSKVVAGSFYLKLDQSYLLMNFYSMLSKLNFTFFTYGDHGLFARKSIFKSIGGFKEIPFMEDVEIQRRLRKAGKFVKLDSPVVTSARRFRKNGVIKQVALDLYLVFLFKLGASPGWLKKFYIDHF